MAGVRVTLLGTGTSTGVPVIGCNCEVCRSSDPRDRRLRCSAYVVAEIEEGAIHLVIDTGPDFRQQALQYGIKQVDGVLFTHQHFDHVVGLDDLRPFCFDPRTAIPCFANTITADTLRSSHGYIFRDGSYPGIVKLTMNEVEGAFSVSGRYGQRGKVEVIPIPAKHGQLDVFGFRIGRFAYLTDVSAIPESSFPLLEGLDVLVLDGLRDEPHPTHLTFADATEVARQVGASETHFIHMTHTVLHAEMDARLPHGIRLGYDGLVLHASLD